MNTPRILSVMIAAAMLGGCAVGPDYTRPEMSLPAAYDVGNTDSAAVGRGWWKLFGDSTLDTLVDRALANNANIALAAARIEQADAVVREAGGALFPEIDADAGASRSRISGVSGTPLPSGTPLIRNNFSAGVSTAFQLDFFGRLRRASEAARAQALASRHGRATVELTLVSQVCNAYLNLRSLDAQLQVTRASLQSREENLRITTRRSERGLSSDLDMQQARGALAALRAQLSDLERQRALAEHQLGLLTGDLELKLAEGDVRALPLPPTPPAGLPARLLDARPDVAQSEAQLMAANAQIGSAKAQLYPAISLTGNFGSQSKELSDLFTHAATVWSLGLALDLPIFDGGKRAARVDQAKASEQQALATYVQTARTAYTEVRDALSATEKTAAVVEAQREQMDAAERTLALAQKRYDAGYSAFLEVLDAQRSANDATLGWLRNRQAQLAASVSLYTALGGGWQAEAQ